MLDLVHQTRPTSILLKWLSTGISESDLCIPKMKKVTPEISGTTSILAKL